MRRRETQNVRRARRLPVALLLLASAILVALVLLFTWAPADRGSPLPPLEAAAIRNGDFRGGLAHWDTRHVSASAQSEVTESGQPLAFARLVKPPEWKIQATMLQELNVRQLQAAARVRVAADFRIPPGGGPATIHVECIDADAPQTEAAQYGQLLVSDSPPSLDDGDWHTQVIDITAPRRTNQLRIFIQVAGDASVDVTGVTVTTGPAR